MTRSLHIITGSWRAPALRPVRIGERCVQFRAKRLEFHRSLECLELVTEIAQPLQSIIDIEKSRLPSHRIISDPSVTMESERRRIGEVLRSIQVAPTGRGGSFMCFIVLSLDGGV